MINIITKSSLLHLRIPFSFFLMPVFLFGWAVSGSDDWYRFGAVFLILHLFLYPASNGYNSYFDKDEGSIGGLKKPPKTTQNLYWTSLVFDLLALVGGLLIINWVFALMLLIYGMVSKAYSHPMVRLKNRAIMGWLAVGFFQGYFTLLMTVYGLTGFYLNDLFQLKYQLPALLSAALLLGSYPMTQIYQHDEDAKRGDQTISLRLGIMGTFHFTGFFFFLSNAGFLVYFYQFFGLEAAIGFQLALMPVMGFFSYWYLKARKDPTVVDFDHTMRLNFISSLMLNVFFLVLGLYY